MNISVYCVIVCVIIANLCVVNGYKCISAKKFFIDRQSSNIFNRKFILSESKFGISQFRSKLNECAAQLQRAGQSGILAYGLLNMMYYTTVTGIVFYCKRDKFMALRTNRSFWQLFFASVNYMGGVAAIVWAGSQVTKLFRMSGAIVLAPFAQKLLSYTQKRFCIQSEQRAFWVLVASILSMTLSFYGALIFGSTIVGYNLN